MGLLVTLTSYGTGLRRHDAIVAVMLFVQLLLKGGQSSTVNKISCAMIHRESVTVMAGTRFGPKDVVCQRKMSHPPHHRRHAGGPPGAPARYSNTAYPQLVGKMCSSAVAGRPPHDVTDSSRLGDRPHVQPLPMGVQTGDQDGVPTGDHVRGAHLRPAKRQVTGGVGGSAGIPDSLGGKPEDTSGRWAGQYLLVLPASLWFASLARLNTSSTLLLI
jgi:hypothetical protein